MTPESTATQKDVFDYYVSPTESLQRERIHADSEHQESVAALFWNWERLRIVYNGALVVTVLLVGGHWLLAGNGEFYVVCVIGAFMANAFYCVGFPLVIYAQRLGIRGRGMSLGLFILGTLLAVGLTGIVCLTHSW